MADNNMVASNEEDEDDTVDNERRGDMSLCLADNHELTAIGRVALKEMQASLCMQEEDSAIKIEEFKDKLCLDITGNDEINKVVGLFNDQEQKLWLEQVEGKE